MVQLQIIIAAAILLFAAFVAIMLCLCVDVITIIKSRGNTLISRDSATKEQSRRLKESLKHDELLRRLASQTAELSIDERNGSSKIENRLQTSSLSLSDLSAMERGGREIVDNENETSSSLRSASIPASMEACSHSTSNMSVVVSVHQNSSDVGSVPGERKAEIVIDNEGAFNDRAMPTTTTSDSMNQVRESPKRKSDCCHRYPFADCRCCLVEAKKLGSARCFSSKASARIKTNASEPLLGRAISSTAEAKVSNWDKDKLVHSYSHQAGVRTRHFNPTRYKTPTSRSSYSFSLHGSGLNQRISPLSASSSPSPSSLSSSSHSGGRNYCTKLEDIKEDTSYAEDVTVDGVIGESHLKTGNGDPNRLLSSSGLLTGLSHSQTDVISTSKATSIPKKPSFGLMQTVSKSTDLHHALGSNQNPACNGRTSNVLGDS